MSEKLKFNWRAIATAVGLGVAVMKAGCAPEQRTSAVEWHVQEGVGVVVSAGPSETDSTKAALAILIDGLPMARATVPITDLPKYQPGEVEVIVDYRVWQEGDETRVEITRVSEAGTPA